MPKTYTVKEIADILGFSTNSIYTFLKEKRIKGVRVGKGRFRIPEEELSRILHLAKKPQAANATPQVVQVVSPVSAPIVEVPQPQRVSLFFWRGDVAFPNFFDWFIAVVTLVSAAALCVFNAMSARAAVVTSGHAQIIGIGMTIASALGLILASMHPESDKWKGVFRGIIAALSLGYAVVLTQLGYVDVGVLYGVFGVAIVIASLIRLRDVASYGLFVSLLVASLPVIAFMAPDAAPLAGLVDILGTSSLVLVAILLTMVLGFIFMYWAGYQQNSLSHRVARFVLFASALWAAVSYAQIQYWNGAFFMMVVAIFAVLVGTWDRIVAGNPKRHLMFLHGIFASVGVALTCGVLGVFLLQQSHWESNKKDFLNKVTTGQNTITQTMSSIESSLVVAAANPSLVSAIEGADAVDIAQLAKVLYESNKNIRRLVFLGAKGDGLALYPYGEFEQSNFSSREYFVRVRDTKRPFTTTIMEVSPSSRYEVGVVVPVLDTRGDFVGAIVGSIDLDRIGLLLSQIAVTHDGEYFVIVDSQNTILFHPDSAKIGSSNASGDVLELALQGKKDVVQTPLLSGSLGIVAYGPVEKLQWGLSLRVPIDRVYVLSFSSIVIMLGAITAGLLFGLWAIHVFLVSRWRVREGSP